MRIAPLLNCVIKPLGVHNNNRNDCSIHGAAGSKNFFLNSPSTDLFIKNQPTFTAINSAASFRNLAYVRKMHCIYCGRPLLSDKIASKLKSDGVFSGPIRNFVKEMLNYVEYLHPSELEFVKRVAIMAFDKPNIRLSEAIKVMYPKANEELLKVQKPIFKELSKLVDEMPYGYKTRFKELLRISRFRLEEKEYVPKEFSGKEFRYKMARIGVTIKDDYMAKKIAELTEPLTHPIFKNDKEPLTSRFVDKILRVTETRDVDKKHLTKKDLQLIILKKIRQYGELLNRRDIISYCDVGINTLEGRPVKIKFSNKAFKYDLNEALEGMNDEQLREKINKIVAKLPTSRTNVNSFITKQEFSASDAIGYNVLRPSIVTIEHLKPKSLGGPNELSNYALACAYDNNNRSNGSLVEFIKQFDRKNQEVYFQEIFEEVANGKIPLKTAVGMVESFFSESGRNIDITKVSKKSRK